MIRGPGGPGGDGILDGVVLLMGLAVLGGLALGLVNIFRGFQ